MANFRRWQHLVIFFSVYALVADGFGITFMKIKNMVDEYKESLASQRKDRWHNLPGTGGKQVNFASKKITQRLDHFNSQYQGKYKQRYWVNDLLWNRPDGPVFLYIGGESAESSSCVQYGAHVELARKYGALIFCVEHRFYGESINADGLKLQNLKYLTSQQALADIAWFHKNVSVTYNLTEKNKWISFGGSYPGSLSAWLRLKYPHLVHAAISSSAPVEAIVDFTGYNNVVGKSLKNRAIGGSAKCHVAVKRAFQTIDEMIDNGNFTQLASDFHICDPIVSDLDVYALATNIGGIFQGIVQYNNIAPSFNVEQICEAMLARGSPYRNLVDIHEHFFVSNNCSDYSWNSSVSYYANTTVDSSHMWRQWLYQTCSQFGYYQTCDTSTDCPLSRHNTLGPNLEMCRILFNLSRSAIYDSIDFTNEYYGSDDPKGSRILFINGGIDPWHALGVLRNLTQSELAILIPTTAHCADLMEGRPDDPPALTSARQKIDEQIGLWLHETASPQRPSSFRSFRMQVPTFQHL